MMLKKVLTSALLVVLSKNSIFADCNLKHELMFSIAAVERHMQRDIGYPYLISFNNKEDFLKLKKILDSYEYKYKTFKNDKRTIDCLSEEGCSAIVNTLIDNGIVNMDMGAFQICYRWNKFPIRNYFDLSQNYADACKLISHHIAVDGNTWESIGNYHSKTKKLNRLYVNLVQRKLLEYYPNINN